MRKNRSCSFSPENRIALLLTLAALVLFNGCVTPRPSANPSFPVTEREARAVLDELAASPEKLERPVLILDGYLDPWVGATGVKFTVQRITSDDSQVLAIAYPAMNSFDAVAERAVAQVQRHFPSDDPAVTVPVDVIAISMGGLVARHAASPRDSSMRRLQIARLFTISSPHRGAKLAPLPTVNRAQKDMRPGSTFLRRLDNVPRDYEIIPYVRIGDAIVGSENAAPPGETPWWVESKVKGGAVPHGLAFKDARILADIASRLRGKPPLTTPPPAPLPAEQDR